MPESQTLSVGERTLNVPSVVSATGTCPPHLYVHLDDRLADDSGTEERPERHQEMAAGDASEVKQGVGDLQR